MINKSQIRAKVWLYPGPAAWHMATLPKVQSNRIEKLFGDMHRGWRSLPVRVTIGQTSWKTSIFMDTEDGAYILPLKSSVRKAEGIKAGDIIDFSIEILI